MCACVRARVCAGIKACQFTENQIKLYSPWTLPSSTFKTIVNLIQIHWITELVLICTFSVYSWNELINFLFISRKWCTQIFERFQKMKRSIYNYQPEQDNATEECCYERCDLNEIVEYCHWNKFLKMFPRLLTLLIVQESMEKFSPHLV